MSLFVVLCLVLFGCLGFLFVCLIDFFFLFVLKLVLVFLSKLGPDSPLRTLAEAL